MSGLILRAIVAVCLFFSVGASDAQTQRPAIPVEVEHQGEDAIGQRLIFFFEEAIRRSTLFKLASDDPHRGFRLVVLTRDPDPHLDTSGGRTMYALATLWRYQNAPVDVYLNHSYGICGASRVRDCADALLVDLNADWEEFLRETARQQTGTAPGEVEGRGLTTNQRPPSVPCSPPTV